MKILDRLPIQDRRASLPFGDKYVTVLRDQIPVWVSVHLAGVHQPEKNIPKIPALLDSGHNFDFSIQYRHLREWAGIDPRSLGRPGDFKIDERPVSLYDADVWLYPNVPGACGDIASGKPPFLLRLEKGIAVYPRDAVPPGPRLPLLGHSALLNNDLDWWLDPERRQITVQTRTWRRHLMRLLCRL